MKKITQSKHVIEVLESRIAPAAVPLTAQWVLASHSQDGSPIPLHAGQGLSTGGPNSGDYLLYLEKGNALIFTTDFNNNRIVDFNEITGIAAGDGMRLISFVDIHGDIVTNLKEVTVNGKLILSLSDSNNNPADDNPEHGGDGRVVLNNRIEKIELRTLTTADIPNQDTTPGVDDVDVDLRRAPSTHSIFGNVYAGGGFGVPGDPTSGLIIDSTVFTNFGFEAESKPSIGSIRVGTAVSGEYFRFSITGGYDSSNGVLQKRVRAGLELGDDAQGYLVPFIPAAGQAGASISYVHSMADDQPFNINGLYAGDGGKSAPGGNIQDVALNGDDAGGYNIVAGKGGSGTRGGNGGSILRFSDLNSDTSKVVIQSGSGGTGTTGAGGSGGNTDITNASFYGNYSIVLGDGGDGFTQGGNGASLSKASISQPLPVGFVPGTGVGTSHSPSYYNPDPSVASYTPTIGTSQGIDIDGDGIGDFVFTSTDTSQLVVMFGGEDLTFRTVETPGGVQVPDRIYLASPRNAEAMVVADLNGDGRPDIAAGSSDISNQAGISVFIAKWEDVDKNGSVNDPVDKFIGFYDPRFSPLPVMFEGDPQTGNSFLPYQQSPHQIAEIVAGDFDGDGANELAVLVQQYNLALTSDGVVRSLSLPEPSVVFMSPDREVDTNSGKTFLTGNFYADFGTREVTVRIDSNTVITAAPQPLYPIQDIWSAGDSVDNILLEATALAADATHDTLIIGVQGGANSYSLRSFDYFDRTPSPLPFLVTGPELLGSWNLGSVDTNRRVAAPNNANTNSTPIGLRDFAAVDLDQDGFTDIIALSQGPTNYVVGVKGNGPLGTGSQMSGNGGDQSGYYLGDVPDGRGIKAMDSDGDGIIDDFAVLEQSGGGTAVVIAFNWNEGASFPPITGPTIKGTIGTGGSVADYRSTQIIDGSFWDLYYADPTSARNPGSAVSGQDFQFLVDPITIRMADEFFSFTTIERIAEPGFAVYGGDGGNSFVGKAGNGGFIGGKGAVQTVIVDPVSGLSVTDYIGSLKISYDGNVRLFAGNGGLGFSKGGNGGSITGVSYRDFFVANSNVASSAFLVAGDGGRGISGAGGFGGDLIANSIDNGVQFFAGDGGSGKTGGRGGSVIGTNQKIGTTLIYDTDTGYLDAVAGNGGNGLKTGGAGGSILNFSPIFSGAIGGDLSYTAGHGGNAIGGVGGAGGSINNSSPQTNAVLEGQIVLTAGNGGNGTKGGTGGSINTFVVTQLNDKAADVIGLVAGKGGKGTTGAGGGGGNISLVDVPSIGTAFEFAFIDPLGSFFSYSRILAGDGGDSTGGQGGAGGKVSSVRTGTVDGTIAVVGGSGGAGMTQGGTGGSITNLTFIGLAAGASSKALVIAGAGGDARAFVPNPNDPSPDQVKKAFGGRIGRGGAGGEINGIVADTATGANMDLIAGDGGSTVHYGNIGDKVSYVGRGGSIQNVNTKGNIGNSEAIVAIKSYNDILNGESMRDFVERRLRVGEALIESLGDSDGNVGIVVGSAGRIKAVVTDPVGAPYEYTTQPAKNARNGDLINITASEIMSAVAGSVDRIASIQLAKNIFSSGGIGTSLKGPTGAPDFVNVDGTVDNTAELGGRLIDGILFAFQKSNIA